MLEDIVMEAVYSNIAYICYVYTQYKSIDISMSVECVVALSIRILGSLRTILFGFIFICEW